MAGSQVENVAVGDLLPYINNAKTHPEEQVVKIAASIKEFGFNAPILADEGNQIIAGHGRLLAAKKLNMGTVPVVRLDHLSEAQKKAYILADNRLGEVGGTEWDMELVSLELESLNELDFDIDLTGFSIDDIAPEETEGLTDEDSVPEVPEEPVSKEGDVWVLGNHRLMCGDSTSIDAVEKLMDGEKADISFTSPPYNAGQTPTEVKMNKTSKYENDNDNKDEKEYLKLLTDFTNNTLMFSEYSFVNIQSLSGNKVALIDFLYTMKELYADTLIWNKQTAQPAMAKNVLNSQYEYIHCFSKKANRAIGVSEFRGTISNVVEISKQSSNKVKSHNATFPIDFALFFVSNFSKNTVLDLFLGSGTTLIAAEKLNRKCYGMELDPKYCDVIVNRWQEYAGKQATHADTGAEFNSMQTKEIHNARA